MIHNLIYVPCNAKGDGRGTSIRSVIDTLRNRILYHDIFDNTKEDADVLTKLAALTIHTMTYVSFASMRKRLRAERYDGIYGELNGLLLKIAFTHGLDANDYEAMTEEVSLLMDELRMINKDT